jgi:AcrR family transcriptional regulator
VSPRSYKSPRRDAATERTRAKIVKAAAAILGAVDGIGEFSLEAVARKAGVTRLTVYNHFGSRGALLETVFDGIAERGGLFGIAQVMAGPDPRAALARIVAIFCDFWSRDADRLALLHAAGANDPEIAASMQERLERRRHVLSVLVRRIAAGRLKPKAAGDLVDVLFALTSHEFYALLTARGRTAKAACELIERLAADAVTRALAETGAGG